MGYFKTQRPILMDTDYLDDGISGATGVDGITSDGVDLLMDTTTSNKIQVGSANRLWITADGVSVGTPALVPGSGQAFSVYTSVGQAFYVADGDRTTHFAWSGGGSSPNIAIGAGSELRFFNDGADSGIYAYTDDLLIRQNTDTKSIQFRCTGATSGDITFETRGATEVARFGQYGLVLAIDNAQSIRLGVGFDVDIGHNGTNTYFWNKTGNTYFQNTSGAHIFEVATAQTHLFRVNAVGVATIDANGLVLSLDGGNSTPNISMGIGGEFRLYHDSTNSWVYNNLGILNLYNDGGAIILNASIPASSVIMQIDNVTTGSFTANGLVLPLDGGSVTPNLKMGIGGDFLMWHDGALSEIRNTLGSFILRNTAAANIAFLVPTSQSVEFQVNSVTSMYVDGDGITIPLDKTTGSAAISLGAGNDMRLTHDGTVSWFYNATGTVSIYQSVALDIRYECANVAGGDHLFFTRGAVEVASFDANGLVLPVDGATSATPNISIGIGGDLKLFHNGTDNFVYAANGILSIYQSTTSNLVLQAANAAGGDIVCKTRGAVEVGRFGSAGLSLGKDGSDGSPNIVMGASGLDFRLYHDGTSNYIRGDTGNIHIRNDVATGDVVLEYATAGQVDIRYNYASVVATFDTATKLYQPSATGAAPTLTLSQTDVSEPFLDFVGTANADAVSSISTLNTSGATTDHIQIDLNGTKAWIAVSTTDPT
tara:strand:- start:781 stop:2910 length:2130 start_codon:yes stop_codon:yes gene_type:complete